MSEPAASRLLPVPGADLKKTMEALIASVKRIRPLDKRREKSLSNDVRELWSGLTRERDTRKSVYLSDPGALSAYLRYFLPWNVYRYLRLLPSLDLSFLAASAAPAMTDYGSGPLALPIALWLAKPELRALPLHIRALDRVPAALEAGKEILADISLALDGKLPAWNIAVIREGADAPIRGKSDIATAAFFLNELDQGRSISIRERAAHAARILSASIESGGRILVIDSGDLRAASLIAALRAELIAQGWALLSPCPHAEPCPMPGNFIQEKSEDRGEGTELIRGSDGRPTVLARAKRPWCHFTFDPLQIPLELERLSARAGLPKARASLSFLMAERKAAGGDEEKKAGIGTNIRVVSESMPDPERGTMNYVCAKEGYGLLRRLPFTQQCVPGDLISHAAILRSPKGSARHDPKTGALIFEIPNSFNHK